MPVTWSDTVSKSHARESSHEQAGCTSATLPESLLKGRPHIHGEAWTLEDLSALEAVDTPCWVLK